jgi:hypothetical protein
VKNFVRIGLGLLCMAAAALPVHALSISPGRTEVRLSPGKELEAALKATNDSPDLIHVTLSTKDWGPMLESNKANKLTVDTWLKIQGPREFDLKPGETREIKLSVKCPEPTQGELVGMVSFMYVTDTPSMMTPIISVAVYMEAAGTETIAGELQSIVVNVWQDQLQAAVSVKSTGNVHLRPTGTIAFQDKKGKEIVSFPIKDGGPAYPGREQGYFAVIPAGYKLPKGRYKVSANLEYRGLKLQGIRDFKVLKNAQVEMAPK